ncbi:hypothetical protein GDO86_005217 [Hymenochirus boettgeri]|uniref:Uncharacterized protein n=1 Tax=Hymenochirus boettgeri TaxID=247094 RepID=A0A8T2J6F5_9PIPI|nr:hypothetical protein GDO86_005217 [Hymenochirus boettgeri]
MDGSTLNKSPLVTHRPAADSSDDSDSEDQVGAKIAATPSQANIKQSIASSSATKPSLAQAQLLAKTGNGGLLTKRIKDDSSESTEDSADYPVCTKTVGPSQSSQKTAPSSISKPSVDQALLLAKTRKAAALAKMLVATPRPVAGSSDSSSDSDEEIQIKNTTAPSQSSRLSPTMSQETQTLLMKMETPEPSDIEDKMIKNVQESRLKANTKSPGAQTPLLAKTSMIRKMPEDSDSSDSEEERDTKKTIVPLQASGKKATAQSKTPVFAQLAAKSSESSDDSTEVELDIKKTVGPQGSQKEAPAPSIIAKPLLAQTPLSVKRGKAAALIKTPVVTPGPVAGSSESSSDSDEEIQIKTPEPPPATLKKSRALSATTKPPGVQTPDLAKKGKAATLAKTPVIPQSTANSSDSSEDSDSEQEPATKIAATPSQSSLKTSVTPSSSIKPSPVKTPLLAKTGKGVLNRSSLVSV